MARGGITQPLVEDARKRLLARNVEGRQRF